jgi:cobalt-zinc-cadmium efflux system outer membrane protein
VLGALLALAGAGTAAVAGEVVGPRPAVLPPPVALASATAAAHTPATPRLACGDAVRWALMNNPNIAFVREQHGIAAAGIVIARTYPFNPIWQSFVMGATGPPDTVTNHVFNEDVFRLDLEIRGQGKIRRQMARATLSRTDWEIAFQETALGVRTIRAFNTVLYRQEKLRLIDETVRFYQESLAHLQRSADQGKAKPADVMLARADLFDVRSQRGPAQAALDAAWQELRRSLGALGEPLSIEGALGAAPVAADEATLTEAALDSRADLRARQLAVQEAEGRLRLEIANRYANPSLGPAWEYNETRVNFIGGWLIWSLPTFNTRQGEILQRRAELERAASDIHQTEVSVQQDVQSALVRLHDANAWVKNFRSDVIPTLQKMQEGFDKLFGAGEPGVDVLRLIDVRRRLLRARDGYLDALWELSQAQADLAAAVGDPSLAIPTPAGQH